MERFAIYELPAGAGLLALCPIPGRSGGYEEDLDILRSWKPDLVVSMTQLHEMAEAAALSLRQDLEKINCRWMHLPVEDFGTLSSSDQDKWNVVLQTALSLIDTGGRVLVHCKGGCGRSGMVILRMMVEVGEDAGLALKRLRQIRPCAVETEAQLQWARN